MYLDWSNIGRGLKDVADVIKSRKIAQGLKDFDAMYPTEAQQQAYDRYNQQLANQDAQTFGLNTSIHDYEYQPITRLSEDQRIMERMAKEANLHRLYGDLDTARQIENSLFALRKQLEQLQREERRLKLEEDRAGRQNELLDLQLQNEKRRVEDEQNLKNFNLAMAQAAVNGIVWTPDEATRIAAMYNVPPDVAEENYVKKVQNKMLLRATIAEDAAIRGGLPAMRELFANHPLFANNQTFDVVYDPRRGDMVQIKWKMGDKVVKTTPFIPENEAIARLLTYVKDPAAAWALEKETEAFNKDMQLKDAQIVNLLSKANSYGAEGFNMNKKLYDLADKICKGDPACILQMLSKGDKQPEMKLDDYLKLRSEAADSARKKYEAENRGGDFNKLSIDRQDELIRKEMCRIYPKACAEVPQVGRYDDLFKGNVKPPEEKPREGGLKPQSKDTQRGPGSAIGQVMSQQRQRESQEPQVSQKPIPRMPVGEALSSRREPPAVTTTPLPARPQIEIREQPRGLVPPVDQNLGPATGVTPPVSVQPKAPAVGVTPPANVQTKSQQAKPQQAKPQQTKPQQAKPQQAKPQQAKPQQAKPQQAKPQQAKPQTKPQSTQKPSVDVEKLRAKLENERRNMLQSMDALEAARAAGNDAAANLYEKAIRLHEKNIEDIRKQLNSLEKGR